MENEQINWSKTLLNSYSYLETICGAIDKTVVSFGVNSQNSASTYDIANKIISLISRKKFLINTKVMVDNVLKNLSKENAKILTIKFIDKTKSELASKMLNLSMRTYFRKIKSAVQQFAIELKNQKYTPQKLFEMYAQEGWIMEIYNVYSQKQNKKDCFDSLNFLGLALKSIKSKQVSYGLCW